MRSTTSTPRAAGRGRNRIVLDGAPVDVGFSIDLTIDPALQALAQKTAACYAGRHDVCQALGLRRNEDKDRPLGEPLLEGAMVRTAAIAIVDVASGRIEALAGAMSPCARQAVDGPLRASSCDRRVPYAARYRPDALLNPAVFHDAMPASTIKPIMAAAFLADADVGARWLAARAQRDEARGNAGARQPARPADALGLRTLPRPHVLHRQGLRELRATVGSAGDGAAFGWNANCVDARSSCGRQDLLFGARPGRAGRRRRGSCDDRSPTGASSASRRPGASARAMHLTRAGGLLDAGSCCDAAPTVPTAAA